MEKRIESDTCGIKEGAGLDRGVETDTRGIEEKRMVLDRSVETDTCDAMGGVR